jgi:hypothetical protein
MERSDIRESRSALALNPGYGTRASEEFLTIIF